MLEIGATEARDTLGALLDRVQEGEEFLITRAGKPVARLIPDTTLILTQQGTDAAERILARSTHLRPINWMDLKHERDFDRP